MSNKKGFSKLKAPKKLKLLITIIDRRKVDFFISALEGYDINVQLILYGHGTYILNKESVSNDKAILLATINEDRVNELLANMEDRYFKTKYGKGIAVVLPLSSLAGVLTYRLLSNTINEES